MNHFNISIHLFFFFLSTYHIDFPTNITTINTLKTYLRTKKGQITKKNLTSLCYKRYFL